MKARATAFCALICLVFWPFQKGLTSREPLDKKVILFAEVFHECNSFSPIVTQESDFMAGCLTLGQEVFLTASKENQQLKGFLEAVKKFGNGNFELIPLLHAKSVPGGPIDNIFFQKLKSIILEGILAQERIDGFYLSMHGAMEVQGIDDPESDIISAIRQIVGNEIPIAISLDLHANLTHEKFNLTDIIVGYRTNPHRDHRKTGFRTGELLVKTMQGKITPVMEMNKLRLLKGGGINVDFLPPFRKIFQRMKQMETQVGVLSVSFFPVQLWLDAPEMGYATLAITNGNRYLARKMADELAEMAWEVRSVPQPPMYTPEEAIEMARRSRLERTFGTVIFCDVADAAGAGAPGKSTWILKALLEYGNDLRTYIPVRDREAVFHAWKKEIGDSVSLKLGGKIDTIYNKPLLLEGKIQNKLISHSGKTLVISNNGIRLILTENPMLCFTPKEFSDLGLSVWNADIVVVKNLFPFRFYFLPYNRKTIHIITPGLTSTDPKNLNYTKIPRPIYPLDEINSWRISE